MQTDGLALTLDVLPLRGVAADIELTPTTGDTFDLPEDLFAVLGWDWARLAQAESSWRFRGRPSAQALEREPLVPGVPSPSASGAACSTLMTRS